MDSIARLVVIVAVMFLGSDLLAQDYVDVVYLNNGSIVRGIIIEQVPNESIKLQTKDGSIFVFEMKDIQKFTKELKADPQQSAPSRSGASGFAGKEREGYVFGLDMSFGVGVGQTELEIGSSNYQTEYNQDYVRVSFTNGAWVADGIVLVGLGLGFEYYTDSRFGLLPVYADVRIVPLKSTVSPVIIFQPGYSFGVFSDNGSSNLPDGLDFTGGLGVHAGMSESAGFEFAVLYDYQSLSNTESNVYFGNTSVVQRYGSVRLSVGFLF